MENPKSKHWIERNRYYLWILDGRNSERAIMSERGQHCFLPHSIKMVNRYSASHIYIQQNRKTMTKNTPFQGFPKEGITFLKNLKRNNNRDWFQEHKKLYKTSLEEPAKAFLEEMSDVLESLSGNPMTGKIFRIYRDVRFSNDKTP